MTFKMGVGVSSAADVFQAGESAAREAWSKLDGAPPSLVLVFCSIRFASHRLLQGIRRVTGEIPLVGCTDAGGITVAGPQRRSVTVTLFSLSKGSVAAAVARHVSRSANAAGEFLGKTLAAQDVRDPRLVLLFPDGLASNSKQIVRGLEATFGRAIPIVGAAAADDFNFQKTFQFFNGEVLTDAAPAVVLGGDLALGVGMRHGWMPLGRPRKVTRAEGHVIHHLDGRPAISLYEDYLGLRRQEILEQSLTRVTMGYPLGTAIDGYPEFLLRDPIRAGKAGSLICTADFPAGSEVQLMIGGYESALEAGQQAALEAIEQVGRSRVRGAMVFCSVARQRMLGSEFHGEIDVIRDALGGSHVTMAGFYSYGEIAPVLVTAQRRRRPVGEFQNGSAVVLALGARSG